MPREPLNEAALDTLLSFARLELSADRRAAAGPMMDFLIGLSDTLDDVDVGETPPASAFDPRWQ
jgi:hypothetical protein